MVTTQSKSKFVATTQSKSKFVATTQSKLKFVATTQFYKTSNISNPYSVKVVKFCNIFILKKEMEKPKRIVLTNSFLVFLSFILSWGQHLVATLLFDVGG